MSDREAFSRRVADDAGRIERAERERGTILGHTGYIGVIGLLFVLPVVGGAYLGSWLDGFSEGYSLRWTIGMILAGVICGSMNVYLFIRE